jgi:hypothetical protein
MHARGDLDGSPQNAAGKMAGQKSVLRMVLHAGAISLDHVKFLSSNFRVLYQTSEILTLKRKGFPGKRRCDSVPPGHLIELSLLRRQSRSRQTSSLLKMACFPYSSTRIPNAGLTMLDDPFTLLYAVIPCSQQGRYRNASPLATQIVAHRVLCASTGRSRDDFENAQQTRTCNLRTKQLVEGFF